jgi:hypothetical protein
MIYLRKKVVDALFRAGISSDQWGDFVNEAVLEKIERGEEK